MDLQKKIWILNNGLEKSLLTIPCDTINNNRIDKIGKLQILFKKIYNSKSDCSDVCFHPNLISYFVSNNICILEFDKYYYLSDDEIKIKISDLNSYCYFFVLLLRCRHFNNLSLENNCLGKFFDDEGFMYHLEQNRIFTYTKKTKSLLKRRLSLEFVKFEMIIDLGGYRNPADKYIAITFIDSDPNQELLNDFEKELFDNINKYMIINSKMMKGLVQNTVESSESTDYVSKILSTFENYSNNIEQDLKKRSSVDSKIEDLMILDGSTIGEINLMKNYIESLRNGKDFTISLTNIINDFSIINSDKFISFIKKNMPKEEIKILAGDQIFLNHKGFNLFCKYLSISDFKYPSKYRLLVEFSNIFMSNVLKSGISTLQVSGFLT